jgi:hypothetical protein
MLGKEKIRLLVPLESFHNIKILQLTIFLKILCFVFILYTSPVFCCIINNVLHGNLASLPDRPAPLLSQNNGNFIIKFDIKIGMD